MHPYTDKIISQTRISRIFDPKNTDSSDYVWHRDKKDRNVTVVSGDHWAFQLDNELPLSINIGDNFFVPKMVFHRLLKGTTPLEIVIDEYD